MEHTKSGRRSRSRLYSLGMLAAGAPLAVSVLAGCGSGTQFANWAPAAWSTSPTSGAPAPNQGESGKGNGRTPASALKYWVTQVLEQHYTEACEATAPAAAPGQDPKTVCGSPDATRIGTQLHQAWTKPGVNLPPAGKVKVKAPASPQGNELTIPDNAVTVGGKSLHDIELIGPGGATTTSFSMTFTLKKIDNTWVVGDFHLST